MPSGDQTQGWAETQTSDDAGDDPDAGGEDAECPAVSLSSQLAPLKRIFSKYCDMQDYICCLYLGGLLDQPGLLLVLLAVVLDMLPQAAGVSVPLVASEYIALVRLLEIIIIITVFVEFTEF